MRFRVLAVLLTATAAVAGLAACASPADTVGPSLVASTNVYAQIAEQVAQGEVDVTAVIDSTVSDPHEYEASAADELAVQRADLIVVNGGGYDPFMDGLIAASGSTAPVVVAVEVAAVPEGGNEHVWYDPAAMALVAEAIADELSAIVPDRASVFRDGAAAFGAEMAALQDEVAAIAATAAGATVMLTEPAPGYLVEAAGLQDLMPEEFAAAVESGRDVPPAVLLTALDALGSGQVRALIANAQTGGAETEQLIAAARTAGIPVLEFTETLPDGLTYQEWMTANVSDLADAVAS